MIRKTVLCLFLIFGANVFAADSLLGGPIDVTGFYKGIVGNADVQMWLNQKNGKITGQYFYEKESTGDIRIWREIQLNGDITEQGKIKITETEVRVFDDVDKVVGDGVLKKDTGVFEGDATSGGISGAWKNPKGTVRHPFNLKKLLMR